MVKCETCAYMIFDELWGEYKCKKKQRYATEKELHECPDHVDKKKKKETKNES